MRQSLFIFFFIFYSCVSLAQRLQVTNNCVEIYIPIGSQLYKNTNGNTLNDVYWGVDINFTGETPSNRYPWAKAINVKRSGIELSYRSLKYLAGNNDDALGSLGESIGAIRNIDIRLFNSKKAQVYFRPGIGVVFLTKTYFNDNKNAFVSSYINAGIKLDLNTYFKLGRNVNGIAGLGYYHISNGGILVPNKGINLISMNLGLSLPIKPSKISIVPEKQNSDYFLHSLELYGGLGRRGYTESTGGSLRGSLSAYYNYDLNDTFYVGIGFDAMYNDMLYSTSVAKSDQYFGSNYEHWRDGFAITSGINFSSYSIGLLGGKYWHFNNPYNLKYFWGMNLKYFLNPNLGLQLKLILHKGVADYLSLGPILRFGIDKRYSNKIGNHTW